MTPRPLICIDIDNVIARTDEVLRRAIRTYSKDGVDLRYEEVLEFDYWRCRDSEGRCFERSEWDHIHRQFTLNHLGEIAPVPNIQRHLTALDRKFEIHLATSRLPEGRDATYQWLRSNDIPFAGVHIIPHRRKHEIGKAFAAAVEDDREQALLFHSVGVSAFLIAHPWNTVEAGSPLRRCKDWAELVQALMGLDDQN